MLRDFLPINHAERVVAGWAIVVTGLMVLGWVAHVPGDLGVIVHPPRWYEALVVVLTFAAAAAGYVYGVEADDRAGMVRTGVLTGLAATSVSALSLPIPRHVLAGLPRGRRHLPR